MDTFTTLFSFFDLADPRAPKTYQHFKKIRGKEEGDTFIVTGNDAFSMAVRENIQISPPDQRRKEFKVCTLLTTRISKDSLIGAKYRAI